MSKKFCPLASAVADDFERQENANREAIWLAQTPQVFRLDLIIKAASHARNTGFLGTDEASVCEHAKIPVAMVDGGPFNIKLTSPQDLIFAGLILRAKKEAGLAGHFDFF